MLPKIIFWSGIWPKWATRPIGTYQLAHHLRKHKIDSQVIEFCQWYTPEQLVEYTSWFITSQTKYLGISTSFWMNEHMPDNIAKALAIIRIQYPQLTIVFGGPRADASTIPKLPSDITILGDAEDKLVKLIKGHNIGIVPFDITKLDHRFVEHDCILREEVLPIELGRGCVFKCKFCGHHNIGKPKHTYQRRYELIEEEMMYNFDQFGTTKYNFLDDTVNEDPEKIQYLASIPSRTGIDINWIGYLRLDLLNRFPDTAYQLKQSGMQSCFFGIESFHPTASRVIGKGWNGKHAKQFLYELYNDIWGKDIPIWNNFIIGLPHETEESLFDTFEWCKANPMGMHRFTPLSLYTARTDTGAKSEFTKSYAEYGFELDANSKWKSPTMNEERAHQLTDMFNTELRESGVNKYACWTMFDILMYGVDLQEAKTMKQSDFSRFTPIFERDILPKYISLLKSCRS